MAGSIQKQKGKKSTSEDKKLSKGKKPSKEVAPEIVEIADEGETDEEDEDEDEDSEDDGVDEEGMANLMKALGDEGLDDIGKMQLEVLAGGEEEEEDDDEEEDGEESDAEDIQDEEVAVENGESVADDESDSEGGEEKETGNGMDAQEIALEDAESVDDDAVARQKVEIDNKVCSLRTRHMFRSVLLILLFLAKGCSRSHTFHNKTGSKNALDRNARRYVSRDYRC